MAKAPAFQLYAADIYMDTNEWSAESVGIYTRLLFHQWVNGSIPADIKKLSQIAFVGVKKMSKSWSEIAPKFEYDEHLRGRNIRLEKTREKQQQFIESQKEKGKRGAEKRWHEPLATAMATAKIRLKPDDSLSSSSSSSIDINNINIGEKPKKQTKQTFKPPSLDDIKNYCAERNNSIDPESFLNHYTSNGWMVGKNKMKDWKAAVRTWEKSNYGRGKDFRTGTTPPYSKAGMDRPRGLDDGRGIPPEYKGDDLPEPVDAQTVQSFIADFKKKLGQDST